MRVFVIVLLAAAALLNVALSAPTGGQQQDYQDLYPYEGLEEEQEEEQQLQQDEDEEEEEEQQQQQQGWGAATLPQDLAYLQLFGDPQGSQLEEALSRAGAIRLPSGNRRKGGMPPPPPYADSPVYYIRMPPSPYVFVPGVGYVSQPPPPPPPPPRYSPFINLPLDFVANGKPTHVYRWPKPGNRPKPPPQQQPVVHHLDKGPYVFNGKPGDKVQVLREQYNALYADALQNLYP